jgi:hypothetical protein
MTKTENETYLQTSLNITNQAETIYQQIFALIEKLHTEAYSYRGDQLKDVDRLAHLRGVHKALLAAADAYLDAAPIDCTDNAFARIACGVQEVK